MSGSGELAALYLEPAKAGTAWLLDPSKPEVNAALRQAGNRQPSDPCDPVALAADLDDLLVLLRERHFGLATGVIPEAVWSEVDGWARQWRQRLTVEVPATWGEALGVDLHRLRWLVRDRHLSAAGEDPALVRQVNPRAGEPVHEDSDGPCVEWYEVAGVLCVRLRTLDDSGGNEPLLTRWRDAHAEHFAHDRIIVDVRGNGGGNDMYVHHWMADHVPAPTTVMSGRGWELGGESLLLWNTAVALEAAHGADAVPESVRAKLPTPAPDMVLAEVDGAATLAAGDSPWHGRMMVLTDPRTGSSGETGAWALRQAFGARLAGGRSTGALRFGNITPYLLPRSGMLVRLASTQWVLYDGSSTWSGHDGVELVGLPVDVPLPADTPLAAVAADFDTHYQAGAAAP
jgi:hypothetical protein